MKATSMPGLDASHVDRMMRVITAVYPDDDLRKPGGWGILPLCCATLAVQAPSWTAATTQVMRLTDVLTAHVTGTPPDYWVAIEFGKLMKKWLPTGERMAKARINPIYRQKDVPLEGRGYDNAVSWTALAIMLNSLEGLDTVEFRVVKAWANSQENGWLKAFFAAGLFLSSDAEFPWNRMAGFLASMDARMKDLLREYEAIGRSDIPPAPNGDLPSASSPPRGGGGKHLPGLSALEVRLDEIVERDVPLFQPWEEVPGLVGQCFAFNYQRVVEAAAHDRTPWHLWLMGLCLAAVGAERHKRPVLAGYTIDQIGERVVRIFLCAKPLPQFAKASRLLIGRREHEYIESGQDLARRSRFRPLAYWDPPATTYALWPPPRDESPGPWNIEPENELGWWSVSVTGRQHTINALPHGRVRVPQEERSAYKLDDVELIAENRWGVLL